MTDFSLEFVFASGEKHSPKEEPNEWLLRSDADTVADSLTVRFSAGKRLFTEEPVGAVLKKGGVLNINVLSTMGISEAAAESEARAFLPAHLSLVFDFGKNTWDAQDAAGSSWNVLDLRNKTWNALDVL